MSIQVLTNGKLDFEGPCNQTNSIVSSQHPTVPTTAPPHQCLEPATKQFSFARLMHSEEDSDELSDAQELHAGKKWRDDLRIHLYQNRELI
jgi:hypothetical protein